MMTRTIALALFFSAAASAFVVSPHGRPATHLNAETLKDKIGKVFTPLSDDEPVPFAEQQTKSIASTTPTTEVEKEEDSNNMMQQIKDAGVAGVISYAAWETAFWILSVPVALVGYQQVAGHWPDLSNQEDLAKLGAEAFAVVNFARLAVPLRVGLALGTTPWVQENVVSRLVKDEKENQNEELP